MEIVQATVADCATITEIYNHAVLHTDAIWNEKTVDVANRIAWLEQHQQENFPVLVAREQNCVVGYATFGHWRAFEGFRYSVEHSVYVAPTAQGRGIGRRLLEQLIVEAAALGKHVMIAGIESQNKASIALHQHLGFVITGQMPQVGVKFGRWLDLTFMQRQLDNHPAPD